MPLDLLEAISPTELTGTARGLVERNEADAYQLAAVLPTTPVDDLDYQFRRGGDALVDAAQYRAYGTEALIGAAGEAVQVRGELPPISEKAPLTEYERLRLRNASDDELVRHVGVTMRSLVLRILNRVELARVDALYTGEVTIAENGVNATIDYGRSGTHDASAGVSWGTTATADPIKDLTDAAELIRSAGGNPTAIFMNSATFAKMKMTDAVKAAAVVGNVQTSVVPSAVVATILEAFGLPPISIYDKQVAVAGSTRKFIEDDKVLIVDATSAGITPTGVTAEQLEWGSDGSLQGGGIFGMSWKTQDPVTVWTKVSAITVPVLTAPNHTVGLDVS